ncbi:hypothetical protein Tco_1289403 [Tanacetum coccineum]
MLTEKWTPMNREITKFNSLVLKTRVMSGENDENWMTRVEILRNRHRVTDEEPDLFGDDELPRPPDKEIIAKSKRSSNSAASSGSTPTMFQEMLQQQYELDQKRKIERINREVNSRVALYDSQKVADDLKVLQMSTDEMGTVDVTIINAQKARIRALYAPQT